MAKASSTSPSFYVTVMEVFRDAKIRLVLTVYVLFILFVIAIHYQMAWKHPGNFGPTVELTVGAKGQLTVRSIEAIPQPKPVGGVGALLLLLLPLVVATLLAIRFYFASRLHLLGRLGFPIVSGCLAIIALLLPWAVVGGDNFKTCIASLLTCVYYSVAAATTTGFGDIYPRSTVARLVVLVEILGSVALLWFILSVFFAAAVRRRVGSS